MKGRQTDAAILAIKDAVRARDGMACTSCGKTNDEHIAWCGRQLDVHRLKPGSLYSIDGCITVCKTCHGKQPKRAKGEPDLVTSGKFFQLPVALVDEIKKICGRYGTTFTYEVVDALQRHAAYPPAREPEPLPDSPAPKKGKPKK